jgi:hypothetical protein
MQLRYNGTSFFQKSEEKKSTITDDMRKQRNWRKQRKRIETNALNETSDNIVQHLGKFSIFSGFPGLTDFPHFLRFLSFLHFLSLLLLHQFFNV